MEGSWTLSEMVKVIDHGPEKCFFVFTTRKLIFQLRGLFLLKLHAEAEIPARCVA